MKTISFAVPCYNSADYMDACIESILKCGDDIEIIIVDDGSTKDDTAAKADELYDLLTGMGLDVLLDDREERPGVKFKDADLVGLPMQVVVGGKGLARGIVEVKNRKTGEKTELPAEGFAEAFAAWRKSVLACWGM